MLHGGYENLPPNSWKPFGNGQRACIGRAFAWQESLLTLNINYAVFGAGHHDWITTYQKIPIYIDEMIANAGGTRIIERGADDAAGDFFRAFEAWKENLFQVLRKTNNVENVTGEEKLSIEIVNSTRNLG